MSVSAHTSLDRAIVGLTLVVVIWTFAGPPLSESRAVYERVAVGFLRGLLFAPDRADAPGRCAISTLELASSALAVGSDSSVHHWSLDICPCDALRISRRYGFSPVSSSRHLKVRAIRGSNYLKAVPGERPERVD
jgi:hypothetical protein